MTKLFVTLQSSRNNYLSYPCNGTLEIQETGTDGSIIVAVFTHELLLVTVRVDRPVFKYPADNSTRRSHVVGVARGCGKTQFYKMVAEIQAAEQYRGD